ncbi:MAG: hypothetical protein Rubg2KO_13170 [Rubricoccaceae bacterium]
MATLQRTLLSALALTLILAGWAVASGPITFERGSSITVEGTSNVHDWDCDADEFMASGAGQASGATLTSLTALRVTVVPANLDCGSGTMNKNLRKATGTSPIVYALTSATTGAVRNGTFPINVQGQLTMHGTTRSVAIRAQGKSLGGNRFQVTGSVPVTMSQFGIDPPRAMMGTMRTGDQATVQFNVKINAGS